MKRIMFFSLFLLSSVFAAAQGTPTFSEKAKTGGFDTSSGTATGETFTLDGRTWEIFQTAKGAKYIVCKSAKTGNNYPVWIGTKTEYTHDGKPVYMSSKGSYCIFKIGKSGEPYAVWLNKE